MHQTDSMVFFSCYRIETRGHTGLDSRTAHVSDGLYLIWSDPVDQVERLWTEATLHFNAHAMKAMEVLFPGRKQRGAKVHAPRP
jgi:hypothetical protein